MHRLMALSRKPELSSEKDFSHQVRAGYQSKDASYRDFLLLVGLSCVRRNLPYSVTDIAAKKLFRFPGKEYTRDIAQDTVKPRTP
jgi:hypothetical protein